MYIVITEQIGAFQVTEEVVTVVRIADFAIPSGITVNAFTAEGEILVGTGGGTYVAKSPGADGQYLKYDSAAIGGVTADTPAIDIEDTTNQLINGGFDFAQRQAPGSLTTIADGGYSADRWKITRENAELQYIRQDGSGDAGLVSPYYGQFKKITNAGKFLICQPLEYVDTLKFRGREINFQIQMKASAASTIKIAIVELQAAGTADTLPTLVSSWNADSSDPTLGANLVAISTPVACSVTTAWQTFQFTGTFPSNSKNIMVMVWTNADFAANDTLSLAEAGLYFGTTLRSWTPRFTAETLRLCQRYYQKSYDPDTGPGTATFVSGVNIGSPSGGTAAWYTEVRFLIPMKKIPTVTTWDDAGTPEKVYRGASGKAVSYSFIGSASMVLGTADTTSASGIFFHYAADAEL